VSICVIVNVAFRRRTRGGVSAATATEMLAPLKIRNRACINPALLSEPQRSDEDRETFVGWCNIQRTIVAESRPWVDSDDSDVDESLPWVDSDVDDVDAAAGLTGLGFDSQ